MTSATWIAWLTSALMALMDIIEPAYSLLLLLGVAALTAWGYSRR